MVREVLRAMEMEMSSCVLGPLGTCSASSRRAARERCRARVQPLTEHSWRARMSV